jgi:hypothetical protein
MKDVIYAGCGRPLLGMIGYDAFGNNVQIRIRTKAMNDTLKRIQARRNMAIESRLSEEHKRAEAARRKAEAAAPLFAAFDDVRNQLVRVNVLKQIWPEDFHSRDDHASVLVAEIIADRHQPYGIKLHVPGGHRRFEVEILPDGDFSYVVSRDTLGGRPHVSNYSSREQWLDTFYGTMASLLEI